MRNINWMRVISIFLVVLLISNILPVGLIGTGYAKSNTMEGEGTEEIPYIITTPEQLNQVRGDLRAHYKLGNDIDLDVFPYNEGDGWVPIGTFSNSFSGSLDGNGKVINDLFINTTDNLAGLFGSSTGNISNIELRDVNVNGSNIVGGLVGKNDSGGTISKSSVTGSVIGDGFVGGLAGSNFGEISKSYAIATVDGSQYIGGLVGDSAGAIKESFAAGRVRAYYGAGGLVGTGTNAPTSLSYWDKKTTGQVASGGSISSFGKLTSEMKQKDTFVDWDFTSTWAIDEAEGYPYLIWPSSPDTTVPTLTAGVVKRTSDAAATVKFTSNVAGQYYYAFVANGNPAPTINTEGDGTSLTTVETTISLSDLESGVKDIYIKVKDMSGNVSEFLKIEIPSYINLQPVITSQPSNASVNAGGSTSFTVIASNATTYKWRVMGIDGWEDIQNDSLYSGAKTAALTITGALISMNGYDYEVIIGNGVSSIDSASARLTVNSAPNSYTVSFDSQGGSAVASKIANYHTKITAPPSPTKSGYLFGGWYTESELMNVWDMATNMVTQNTTLYAKWNVYNQPTTEPKPNRTPSTTTQPKVEEINVDVESGTSITKTPIKRITEPDGTVKDLVTFALDKVKETIEKLKEQKQDTARIVIPDKEDNVSEVSVTVPKESISTLANGKANLEIYTANAHIYIPQASIRGFGEDLYFRVVPIKGETQKNEVEERAKKETFVQLVVGNKKVNVLGRPMEIETNMQNRSVDLTLPLPTNATKEQMDNLAIFIEHSDGTKEVIQGKLVEFDKGTQGLKFTVNKFSTFTIMYMEGAAKYFAQTSCGANTDCLQVNKTTPVYVLEKNRFKKVSELVKGQTVPVKQVISPMLGLGGDIWLERTAAISYETPSKEMLAKNQLPANKLPKQIWKGQELTPGQIGKVTILQDTVIWKSIDKKTKLLRILKKGEQYRVYRYVPGMYQISDQQYIVQP
ncbi:InlB B-repeat-containing protein [Psychrobacillus sp. L3]|uniref:InlB B-repeat-containing protein n=1 Tax=Psychrobacillus sp. L3 TaxID=3236891 RepID=UPI0036F232A3